MSTASAEPSSPKGAAASAVGFSTPSKRSSTQIDVPSGPADAAKKRRCTDNVSTGTNTYPARDVTCSVCLEPVAAAAKPSGCGHLLCHTCAHGLWCCPQCRAEVTRPCPTCRTEMFFEELQGDREADKIAADVAKTSLSPKELGQWRQRKADGLELSKRIKQGGAQAAHLAIAEERAFVHAVILSRSPSSRAVCPCCSEHISRGSLRVHRADGRFSHVACHDMEAELKDVCTGERVGLGEVHVSVETNIVDPKLMRPDLTEVRRVNSIELRDIRQKLLNAAGMSQWFCESALGLGQ